MILKREKMRQQQEQQFHGDEIQLVVPGMVLFYLAK
jgi:hypothetical protein